MFAKIDLTYRSDVLEDVLWRVGKPEQRGSVGFAREYAERRTKAFVV